MSPSDKLRDIQAKMQEYKSNGVKLGWLINSQQQQVEIYRLEKPKETVSKPACLSGEEILPNQAHPRLTTKQK